MPSQPPTTVTTLLRSVTVVLFSNVIALQQGLSAAETVVLYGPTQGDLLGPVEVAGMSAELRSILQRDLQQPSVQSQGTPEWFSVRVIAQDSTSLPAVLGQLALDGNRLQFTPRFAWRPGVRYRAAIDLNALTSDRDKLSPKFDPATNSLEFEIPLPKAKPAAIDAIYPSRDLLPENLLKFYIHFTQPMRRGASYRAIELLDASGQQIQDPFLELGEELWDRSGTRFTLLLDPGRIKRGLVPHAEAGPVLQQGGSYTLVINTRWRSAAGRPLSETYRKQFRVAAPDSKQPNMDAWKIELPNAGTSDPLTIRFEEALDHAMLQRALVVRSVSRTNSGPIEGRLRIGRQENLWQFHPQQPWQAGRYVLAADATLEDLAGNSLGRPFEGDLANATSAKQAVSPSLSQEFVIRSPNE